jgi:hypothetical protein
MVASSMLCLGLVAALALQPPAAQLTAAEGRVVDSSTKQPIAGSRVILIRTDRPGATFGPRVYDPQPASAQPTPESTRLETVTGDSGEFSFRVRGTVSFALFADAPGYVKSSGVGPENTFEATPLEPRTGIVLRLAKELSISGRVIDRDTEKPLRGFSVATYRYVDTGAGRTLFHSDSADATTDADGRFTIQPIAPGRYYLETRSARPRVESPKPPDDSRSTSHTAYAPSWYPGADSAEVASPVELVEGVPVEGLKIEIPQTRTASIRGRVLAPGSGDTPGDAELTLIAFKRPIGAVAFSMITSGKVSIGATYQIDGLPAGNYYLLARTARPEPEFAVVTLRLEDQSQNDVNLLLHAGLTVTGRVTIEGREDDSGKPALPSDKVLVDLEPMIRMRTDSGTGPVAVNPQDGSFTIRGVIPDKYYVRVYRAPSGYAVDEVRYRSRTCVGRVVRVEGPRGDQQLDVGLARAAGSIALTVTDGTDPSPGAEVLILPQQVDEDALDTRFDLTHVQADAAGKAAVNGLVPGVYRVLAYPHDAAWGDDPYLRQHFATAQEMRVSPSGPAVMTLRTEPAP